MVDEHRTRHVDFLEEHMENYNVEASALHRKLQSKAEALKIMRKELEKFRTERDQFKLMAETLQLRYSAIKRTTDFGNFSGYMGNTSTTTILNETREKNLKLITEVEALKQKLAELEGDMLVLRKQGFADSSTKVDVQANEFRDADWKLEKADFISHLECLKKKNAQLAFDVKTLLDEKEEAVTERDAYKCKSHRLNHELLMALKANETHPRNAQLAFDVKTLLDEKEEAVTERDAYKCKSHRLNHELLMALKANETHPRIVDIDGLILENKYLQEKLKHCESELEVAQQSANKYKTMLDSKRKKGIIKLGTNNIDNIMSHKQVKAVLENSPDFPTKTETIADLKSLCLALLDNLNDKNLALSHQKRTNKILATRIAELEQRIQLVSGKSNSCTFSPSEILLNGYTSSNVDCETKSSNITEDSGTMSSDESNKTSRVSEDYMDSFSSESNRSIISSEYENSCTINNVEATFNVKDDKASQISSTILKERLEDLKDLPPELAEMVQNALHELDVKDMKENGCDAKK